VPGPSAALAALVASGLPVLPLLCVGFPPRRASARRAAFEALATRRETVVLFESPRRLGATLAELAACFGGDRRACVAREISKLHESFERGTLAELAERFASGARGEVTLVVEGRQEEEEADSAALEAGLREALARGASARDAARDLARRHGVPRREAYLLALALRTRREP
jgi:16S rRNA (cytidine1402-2'-O)-methyltransferase